MFYDCTATGHSEFTCLSAYYCGPKKYRQKRYWCDNCRATYKHPTED